MKYNSLFVALLLGSVSAIKYMKSAGEEAAAANQADDLDALMDKYDDQEKKKDKPVEQTTTKNGVTVTKGQIVDAELRILPGN